MGHVLQYNFVKVGTLSDRKIVITRYYEVLTWLYEDLFNQRHLMIILWEKVLHCISESGHAGILAVLSPVTSAHHVRHTFDFSARFLILLFVYFAFEYKYLFNNV